MSILLIGTVIQCNSKYSTKCSLRKNLHSYNLYWHFANLITTQGLCLVIWFPVEKLETLGRLYEAEPL